LAGRRRRGLARAQERLDLGLPPCGRRGIIARGEIGDADPLLAIEDALAGCPAHEVVIAILPPGRSNWIERGLVEKATARFGIPVAHLVSGYDLIEGAASKPARAAA
jgi:hypothetical protein